MLVVVLSATSAAIDGRPAARLVVAVCVVLLFYIFSSHKRPKASRRISAEMLERMLVDHFFQLMDRLVLWQRYENREPLEIGGIFVMEQPRQSPWSRLLVWCDFYTSDEDVRRFFSGPRYAPEDAAFAEEALDWFKFGPHPFMPGEYLCLYQSCMVIPGDVRTSAVMAALEEACALRYPGAYIKII